MCNLYAHLRAQDAWRQMFPSVSTAALGNLAPQPGIWPDQRAPILREAEGGRAFVMARWGLPTPQTFLAGRNYDKGVTNVRNTGSAHWRRWLGPANRCLVPLTAFAEPDRARGGNAWFALPDDPPAFFAGIHVPGWTSTRKVKDGPTTDDLFAFLTTSPNAEVAQAHEKAMPVILTAPADWETWLTAPWAAAAALQQPLPDGSLVRIADPGRG